jgi:hypothetical protein
VRPFTIKYIIESNPITPQTIASGLYTKPLTDNEELCCIENLFTNTTLLHDIQ